MKKLLCCVSVSLACLIITGALISCGGRASPPPEGEGFAIYLTRDDIPPSQMEMLSHVDIADQPVVSLDDVITYTAQTHELKLSDAAFERIVQLEVPVRGRSFLVCVDHAPIYWGAFWTPVSSMSFDGVTIWQPLPNQDLKIVTIELGYPSSSFYGGEDPRDNPVVIDSLDKAGKLINKLTLASLPPLPKSMKGYELYSWPEDGQWRFTLITGTNRNKTPQEIVSTEDFISEAGWQNIHVTGVTEIKQVLGRLPSSEWITWCGGMRLTQPDDNIKLPPDDIVKEVKDYAIQCGLEFNVSGW